MEFTHICVTNTNLKSFIQNIKAKIKDSNEKESHVLDNKVSFIEIIVFILFVPLQTIH